MHGSLTYLGLIRLPKMPRDGAGTSLIITPGQVAGDWAYRLPLIINTPKKTVVSEERSMRKCAGGKHRNGTALGAIHSPGSRLRIRTNGSSGKCFREPGTTPEKNIIIRCRKRAVVIIIRDGIIRLIRTGAPSRSRLRNAPRRQRR